MQHSPGKIFLTEQRGRLATAAFRRYCTFRFGDYVDEHKAPFGRLLALNEETLVGGQAVALPTAEAVCVLVLPLLGAVRAGTSLVEAKAVEVGEIWVAAVPAGGFLHLGNLYEADLVCCLHLWLAVAPGAGPAGSRTQAFEASSLANQLRELLPGAPGVPGRISLGRFAGRTEATYVLRQPGAGFFAFVLAGAFEVAGRLLHASDGLALWDVPAVEAEALSNDALLLVLELDAFA